MFESIQKSQFSLKNPLKMKVVLLFLAISISYCVASCPPNSVSTRGPLFTCDYEGVQRRESIEQKSVRLNCPKEGFGNVNDGCNVNFCKDGLIMGSTYIGCNANYNRCTVGSSYKTADKVCICEADGLLKCA
jgi:hypothetical protein